MPGFWRGVGFHVPDTSTAAGRRIAEQLFPGVDLPAYDDFGTAPAIVSIEGLIVGDDYAAKGAALIAAMEMPGPATLVHPWLGPMTVMLEEPGQVFFSDRELRVTRFSVQFKRLPLGGLGGLGRLAGSLSALTAAVTSIGAVVGTLAAAHDRRTISAARQRSVNRATRIFRSAAAALAPPARARRALPRLLASIPTVAPTGAHGYDVMVSSAVAILAAPALTPAVSPAAGAAVEASPSPLALMTMALDLGEALTTQILLAPSPPDAVLLAAASVRALAAGAGQSIYASYESRREALSYRSRFGGAIGNVVAALETMSASAYAGETGSLRRELATLQAAIAADINERIGRLPDVLFIRPDMPVEAWQVAHHLFGDDPQSVEPAFRDIVRRNRPRHPAHMDGPVEVLR
nr:DNA circularization N-terminal domain-containing protein [Shinella pollutisoli]